MPRRVAPPPEARAEERFAHWVKHDRGGVTRKMNGLGFRSWPDRQVLKPKVRRTLWIEFKRIGEELTRAQELLHDELRRLGQEVVTCYTFEEAVAAYEAHR